MEIKFKNNYLQYGDRSNLKTTIRQDLLENLKILSVKCNQPISKIMDVLLLDNLHDEDSINELINKINKY